MLKHPNYSSDPKNEHYGLYCKYQLLKYKLLKCSPDDAWNNLEQSDETYITCWRNFLSSESSKLTVPHWETKMEALKTYIKPSDEDSIPEHNDSEEEKEEWMLMSQLIVETADKECPQSIPAPPGYWHDVHQYFTSEEIDSMPTWLNTKKIKYNQLSTQDKIYKHFKI